MYAALPEKNDTKDKVYTLKIQLKKDEISTSML